jgi:hypothetical protein
MYPSKMSFIIEGEIKTFYVKQKLKEFMITKPKVTSGTLHREGEDKHNQENNENNNSPYISR